MSNYLVHFNKNHSKANGQFVSGDGDGDGIVDDHANRSKKRGQYSAKIENYHKGTLFKDPYYIDKKGNKRSYDTYKDMPYDVQNSERARAKVKKYGGIALKAIAVAAATAGAAYTIKKLKDNNWRIYSYEVVD